MLQPLTEEEAESLYLKAGEVFHPATPIQTRELFAGRLEQLAKVADAVFQKGLHVVLYGERGVGKTSLANMLPGVLESIGSPRVCTRVTCSASDSFPGVWKRTVESLSLSHHSPSAGFGSGTKSRRLEVEELLPEEPSPHHILTFTSELPFPLVCVFDEFDRVQRSERRMFTDLIKALSDHGVDVTLILVGVADTVTQLVQDHASIDRALLQVHMPRMKEQELRQILDNASKALRAEFVPEASTRIVRISQGLPHYTHALGRDTIRAAAKRLSSQANAEDVRAGCAKAVDAVLETTKTQYYEATRSGRKDALFDRVILACAMAPKDELSYFQPADIAKPMSVIMKKQYDIPSFAKHLNAFCDKSRGRILERSGMPRRYRYRFTDPLMEPYVVMRGLKTGVVSTEILDQFTGDSRWA